MGKPHKEKLKKQLYYELKVEWDMQNADDLVMCLATLIDM